MRIFGTDVYHKHVHYSKQSENGNKHFKGSHHGKEVDRNKQLVGKLKETMSITFLSLRGSKSLDLSPFICGSTKPLSSMSLTIHFWKT